MSDLMMEAGLGDLDPRLLEEAFRRACAAPSNRDSDPRSILSAILDEARRGTQHLHGLVGAANRTTIAA